MKLKEVIHYYIGQQFRCKIKDSTNYTAWMKLVYDALAEYQHDPPEMQLALRPLSDMTEEEMRELVFCRYSVRQTLKTVTLTYKGVDFTTSGFTGGGSIVFTELNAAQFHYLLSRGFDLFGLLESGEAVNAKTI